MSYEDAYHLARKLAQATREMYVISTKCGRDAHTWYAEPQWLYETTREQRCNPLRVHGNSPVNPPERSLP